MNHMGSSASPVIFPGFCCRDEIANQAPGGLWLVVNESISKMGETDSEYRDAMHAQGLKEQTAGST